MEEKSESATFNPASKVEGLSKRQADEIKARSRPNAALIHETIRAEGENELERHWWAILLSGFAAGLSIALSLIVQGEFHTFISDGSVRRLVAPLGYSIRFLVVVLGRQQLFTENTLTPILPLLHHRDRRTLLNVLRLWGLVLLSNIAGTWVAAFALAHGNAFEKPVWDAFVEISRRTVEHGFLETVFRGVLAGWLIALMMWLLPAANGSRPLLIIIMTYILALCEFSHIIAGSVDCAFLVQIGKASMSQYLLEFFVPTLVGNVLGGTTLVALLNYGQVAAELDAAEQD